MTSDTAVVVVASLALVVSAEDVTAMASGFGNEKNREERSLLRLGACDDTARPHKKNTDHVWIGETNTVSEALDGCGNK